MLRHLYDIDELTDTIMRAGTMPELQGPQRMERTRAQVANNDVYHWGRSIFERLTLEQRPGEQAPLGLRLRWNDLVHRLRPELCTFARGVA